MKVEFLRKFSKDLDHLSSPSIRKTLITIIETLEESESLDKIPNTKKLKGHRTAYRIRIGDYRLGFFLENSTILLARFVHRKDIYKLFP